MKLEESDYLSLLRGDGLFETLRIEKGRIWFVSEHLYRLRRSAEALGFPEVGVLAAEKLLSEHPRDKDRLVRLTLLRSGRILLDEREIEDRELPLLTVLPGFYSPGDFFREHKTISWGRSMEALRQARLRKADEVIALSSSGLVGEGAAGNLFFRRPDHDHWVTPPVDGILPGVYRKILLQEARKAGIEVVERDVHSAEIRSFTGAVITSAGWVAAPVKGIDERPLDLELGKELAHTLLVLFRDSPTPD